MSIPKIASYELPDSEHFPQNKVNWQVEPQNAVLLIHDMQCYFMNFFDTDAAPVPKLKQNIQSLAKAAREAGIPVIYTAQPVNQDPEERALLTDFWGQGLTCDAEIISELTPEQNDICLTKWRYSAFRKNELHEYMRSHGRNQIIICGVYGHIGILSTTLEAFMLDIKPFVVGDAIADFSAEEHEWTMKYVTGRAGAVKSLQTVLDEISVRPDAIVPAGLTLDRMKHDIAQVLEISIDELDETENLLFYGLDSVRAMTLLEKWQQQGTTITFAQLMEKVTLQEWWQLIEDQAAMTPAGCAA
ncbi:Vibriobactin-specific isochorismatase [Vibrio aerogenes CECT 7868]|uniref:isochorismatase n=1 Tax=Vibrio aerogenes CECT 7868 TaxID=1216006 RepID=A0A1M5VUV8_9VIBR|nr:isochorismatase family protein [Vibrio aerogenes]SHH78713.1 Vibriobactin-specific isochorismatase [Vibrio aerogenes CECT 7868]